MLRSCLDRVTSVHFFFHLARVVCRCVSENISNFEEKVLIKADFQP